MRLIISFVFVIVGMAIFAIPNMTRRGVLFGFAVPASFREGASGRKSIAEFRALVLVVLIAALSALFFSPENFLGLISVVGPLLILLAGGTGFVWQHRKVAPFAVEPTRRREAELTNAPDRVPWFIWLAPGPFAILAFAAGFLYLNWETIPARFPVHWAVDGQPNGWNERTVRGVYGPILFGAELGAWMLIMALATWFGARRSRFRRVMLAGLVAIEYMIGLMFAALAVEPLAHVPIWMIVVGPLFVIVPVLIAMARSIAEPTGTVEPTPNECWKAGMIYYNPNDPALFVEKRAGLGYTFNLANRWSWVLAAGLGLVIASTPWVL